MTIADNDPVILQWYSKEKRRHVFVVPRKIANRVKSEHLNARIHIWEFQAGLLLAASALVREIGKNEQR